MEVSYQKVIVWHAKDMRSELDRMVNADAPISKIDQILDVFSQARQGDPDQIEHVLRLVGMINNLRSIREMLRGSAAEIKRMNGALKVFLDFNNEKVLEFL